MSSIRQKADRKTRHINFLRELLHSIPKSTISPLSSYYYEELTTDESRLQPCRLLPLCPHTDPKLLLPLYSRKLFCHPTTPSPILTRGLDDGLLPLLCLVAAEGEMVCGHGFQMLNYWMKVHCVPLLHKFALLHKSEILCNNLKTNLA